MFKSISSWFQKGDSGSSRKNLALNSTRDAFSLPTHSPTFNPPHPSPYSGRMAFNDSFDEPLAATSSYTYPPPSSEELYRYETSTQYDRGLPVPHKGPLLPVHQTRPLSSSTYPSLSTTWIRIRSWLSEEYAELGDTLNWGCLPELLEQVEGEIGFSLPVSVRESFCNTDGQELESLTDCPDGLFFGLNYLTLEEAFEEWKFWRTVDLDPSTGANPSLQATMQSIPAGYIRCRYSDPGWFPLATDRAGNYLGVDMNPGDKGTSGQVIVFGRDFDVKIVLSQGDGEGAWARWLASFAEELETGETFEIGAGSADASEGSDDGIGYGSYFYDGSGSTKGEGGGPGGSPGLHLTGGYRGWPVLEAFADRAFHVWQHLGKITTPSTPTPNGAELIQTPPSKEVALIQIPDDNLFDEAPSIVLTSKGETQSGLSTELPQKLLPTLPQVDASSSPPFVEQIHSPTPPEDLNTQGDEAQDAKSRHSTLVQEAGATELANADESEAKQPETTEAKHTKDGVQEHSTDEQGEGHRVAEPMPTDQQLETETSD